MGGGGFMQHAHDTNRKDRNQKSGRREKFKGNHSEKMVLGSKKGTSVKSNRLSKEQVRKERSRLKRKLTQRRRMERLVLTVSVAITFALLLWLWMRFT